MEDDFVRSQLPLASRRTAQRAWRWRCTITVSLVVIAAITTAVTGAVVVAVAYTLNKQGVDASTSVVQNQTVNAVFDAAGDFALFYALEVISFYEYLRVQEKLSPGFSSASNGEAWLPTCFASAKAVQSLYVAYPNGDLLGYRGVVNSTLLWGNATSGLYEAWLTDSFGEPVGLYTTLSTKFNATLRPWYMNAVALGAFAIYGPHALPGQTAYGLTFSLALYADLLPVRSLALPSTGPPTRPPSTRRAIAVVSADAPLQSLSSVLHRAALGVSSRTLAWFFTSTGATMAGISNSSIAIVSGNSTPLTTSQVASPLLNATMAWLLAVSGISVNDVANYSHIKKFYANTASLLGEDWIITCQPLNGGNIQWTLVIATPYSAYYSQLVYASTLGLIVIFCCILPVMVAFSGATSHFAVSLPAQELADCMSSVASQLMFKERRMGLSHITEISQMQDSFDAMRSSIVSFTKFAPLATVRAVLASKTEAMLGVEERAATMFFSDIEGFTSISERVPPHELILCLEEYFDAMTRIIEDNEGTVGDFVGDSIFAFWGAPTSVGVMHASLAVRAAWAQQMALTALREQWRIRGLPQLRVRMGINSGNVLAGTVGSQTRLKYTLIGDSVNLAARLESLAKYYGLYLVISEVTWKEPRVQEEFVSMAIDTVHVVGKNLPTTILTIVALRSNATVTQLALEALSWQMIALYRDGDFAGALALLDQMTALAPDDMAISKMRERVQVFSARGAPADWQGAFIMEAK